MPLDNEDVVVDLENGNNHAAGEAADESRIAGGSFTDDGTFETGEIMYVGADILRLRDGPGTEYEIIDRLVYGTSLKLLNKKSEWFRVQTDNYKDTGKETVERVTNQGWVHSDYVIVREELNYPMLSSADSYESDMPISLTYWSPGDYWFGEGYEFYFYIDGSKLSFDSSLDEIYSVLGEPNYIFRDEDYAWELHYPLMVIGFFDRPGTDVAIEETDLCFVEISDPDVVGPRGIRVGDTLQSLLKKIPNGNAEIKKLDEPERWAGITAYFRQLLYNFNTDDKPNRSEGPYAYIAFCDNKKPLYAYFCDNDHSSRFTGSLIVHFKDEVITRYSINWNLL